MTYNTFADGQKRPYPVFNPIFEEFSNERLYAALCDATASLDEGLKELHQRLKPIILNAARGFLNVLSWTTDSLSSIAPDILLHPSRTISSPYRSSFHTLVSGSAHRRQPGP